MALKLQIQSPIQRQPSIHASILKQVMFLFLKFTHFIVQDPLENINALGTDTLNLNKNDTVNTKQRLPIKLSNPSPTNEQIRISNNSAFSNTHTPNMASVGNTTSSHQLPYRASVNPNTDQKSTFVLNELLYPNIDNDYNNILNEKVQTKNSQDLKVTTKGVKHHQQLGSDVNMSMTSNYDTMKNTAKRNYWMSNRETK